MSRAITRPSGMRHCTGLVTPRAWTGASGASAGAMRDTLARSWWPNWEPLLAADLGLSLEPRADHASYIADWIKVLKGDKRAIFSAAAHAERAVKFLHGLQPGAQPAGADASNPDRRAFVAQAFEAAA